LAAFNASAQVNIEEVPVHAPLLSVCPTKQRIHMSVVPGARTVPSANTLKAEVGVLIGMDVFSPLMQLAWEFSCERIPKRKPHAILIAIIARGTPKQGAP
jgi:hypothetical protein